MAIRRTLVSLITAVAAVAMPIQAAFAGTTPLACGRIGETFDSLAHRAFPGQTVLIKVAPDSRDRLATITVISPIGKTYAFEAAMERPVVQASTANALSIYYPVILTPEKGVPEGVTVAKTLPELSGFEGAVWGDSMTEVVRKLSARFKLLPSGVGGRNTPTERYFEGPYLGQNDVMVTAVMDRDLHLVRVTAKVLHTAAGASTYDPQALLKQQIEVLNKRFGVVGQVYSSDGGDGSDQMVPIAPKTREWAAAWSNFLRKRIIQIQVVYTFGNGYRARLYVQDRDHGGPACTVVAFEPDVQDIGRY